MEKDASRSQPVLKSYACGGTRPIVSRLHDPTHALLHVLVGHHMLLSGDMSPQSCLCG
jgi:hypothetical protein